MPTWERLKNRLIAKLVTRFPVLARPLLAAQYVLDTTEEVPWTPVRKPLRESTVAVVTTAGVHHRQQKPFDMLDREGDPSFRVLNGETIGKDFRITHDYYDHGDAERDLNIVLPLQRLEELAREGAIGRVADDHYGFMGHITGRHLSTLLGQSAPQVTALLKLAGVDCVLLTPA